MNKNKQLGFGFVGILVVVLLVGLLAFIGLRVFEAQQQKPSKTEVTKHPKLPIDVVPSNYLIYADAENTYSFEYPKTWKKVDRSSNTHLSLIESPDYAKSDEGIGPHLTGGAAITVDVEDTEATSPEELLAMPKYQFRNSVMYDKQSVKMNDRDAISYKLNYEGSRYIAVATVYNGKGYTVRFDYTDEATLEKYKSQYEVLIKSFKTTQ